MLTASDLPFTLKTGNETLTSSRTTSAMHALFAVTGHSQYVSRDCSRVATISVTSQPTTVATRTT